MLTAGARKFKSFTEKLLWRRKESYQRIFFDDRGGLLPDAEIILADLRRFCNATKPSIRLDSLGKLDSHAMAVAEGRREVWNRINGYLYLTERTIQNLTEE